MSVLLSIDPGVRGCGCALFADGKLIGAAYVKSPIAVGHGPREAVEVAMAVVRWHKIVTDYTVTGLALEWPQSYGGRAAKGDANDNLIPLAAVDGALAALFPDAKVQHFVPHAWKGNVSPKPKSVKGVYPVRGRVEARLSEVERARIEWPTAVKLQWDVADAIGVGLYALGRFEVRRALAGE